MTAAAPSPVLPDRLAVLCEVAGVAPGVLRPHLPRAAAATEQVLADAIRAERAGDPLPRHEPGHTSAVYELRLVVRRVLIELRHVDAQIARLSTRRAHLAGVLGLATEKRR